MSIDDLNDLKIMIVPLNLLHAQKMEFFKYVIIGGGYLENDLKRLVNKYNLQNNILFMGKILNAKNICTV